jgi:hypothetical protein
MYYGDLSKFDVIAKFNSIQDGTSLKVGQELKIPEIEGLPFLVKGETVETKTAVMPQEPAVSEAVPQKEEVIRKKKKSLRIRQLTIGSLASNFIKTKNMKMQSPNSKKF